MRELAQTIGAGIAIGVVLVMLADWVASRKGKR